MKKPLPKTKKACLRQKGGKKKFRWVKGKSKGPKKSRRKGHCARK